MIVLLICIQLRVEMATAKVPDNRASDNRPTKKLWHNNSFKAQTSTLV